MRNIYYSVKSQRLSVLVPIAFICVIFPLLTYNSIKDMQEELYKFLSLGEKAQSLIPVMAAWCPLMAFRRYVEGDARELIFFYKKRHIGELLFYAVFYCVITAVPFLILSKYLGGLQSEYLRVIIQGMFFLTLAYCVTFLLSSATGGLLVCLLIDFLLIFGKNYIPADKSIFSFGMEASKEMFVLTKGESVDKYWILIIMSAVFLLVGYISSRRAKT